MAGYLIICIENTTMPLKRFHREMLRYPHRIVTAITATRGMELVESGNPDLILLDPSVSSGGPFDLVRRIRANEITAKTPIIFLSDGFSKDDLITARSLGVVDFVSRPYKIQVLEEKVARIFERYAKETVAPADVSGGMIPSRGNGRTVVQFRPGWLATVQSDVQRVFSGTFLKQIKNDALVLDLRALPELSEKETAVIDKLVSKLAQRSRVHILAGRHFGALVTFSDLENRADLFLTREELELFLSESSYV